VAPQRLPVAQHCGTHLRFAGVGPHAAEIEAEQGPLRRLADCNPEAMHFNRFAQLLVPTALLSLTPACSSEVDPPRAAAGGGGAPATSAASGEDSGGATGDPASASSGTTSSTAAQSSGSGTCMPTGDETCAGTADEDCDGTECAVWARLYDFGGWIWAAEAAVASNGDVFVTGKFGDRGDTLVFAGQSITADAAGTAFLAKLSPQGDELWIRKLPSDSAMAYVFVGVTDTSVLVHTSVNVPTDFGGGPLAADGGGDRALVAFDPVTGAHRWSTMVADAGPMAMRLSGISALGEAVFVGHAPPGASYDGTTITDPLSATQNNGFGMAVDVATGSLVWHQSWSLAENEFYPYEALAFGPQGDIYIAGDVSSDIAFGGPQLVHTGDHRQGFLAHLDADGQWMDGGWMCTGCTPTDLAVGPAGEVAVAAGIDDHPLGDIPNTGMVEHAIFGVDAEHAPSWVVYISSNANIEMTSTGEVSFLYSDWNDILLDGQALPAIGDKDLLLGRIGTDGTLLWHRQLGAPGASVYDPLVRPFALQPDGKGIGVLWLDGAPVDLGCGPLAPVGTQVGIVQFAMQ
jgi:hypothetical protein